MSVSSGFSTLNLDEVEESKLLNYYLGITSIPCRIKAPYRIDNKPSVGIYLNNNDKIQYVDFATRESGGVIDLLMKMWSLDFKHTLDKISKDLSNLSNNTEIRQVINTPNISISKKSNVRVNVKFREWKPYDLEYWESYGISLPWLEFGDVHPISRIFYTNENSTIDFPAEKYAYAYIERKDGIVTLKIYQPFSTIKKWINKHDASVWDLWSKLPARGEYLIITSSRKDALCIWENTGIPSISLQGEGYIPKEHVIQELKNRFGNIFILYDNDFQATENHGRILGKELADKFNLTQIEIPDEYKCKDISDLCKKFDRETVYQVINLLISTYEDLPF